jgi:hypothetical protein
MDKNILSVIVFFILILPLFSGCLEYDSNRNKKPMVEITYPLNKTVVSNIVMISGTASDPDGNDTLENIEIRIGSSDWFIADGTIKWSFDWIAHESKDGFYNISVRAWDGIDYSDVEEIYIRLDNPVTVESDSHKWAIFLGAANFPKNNESKLGNGGLYLAEKMAAYFIENLGYSTSNIIILFDDGWIRSDNGFGSRLITLQQRKHDYNVIYGGATIGNVETSISHVISESNKYMDSEVFIWMFSHGCGDQNNTVTGGKVFESSEIFLWDGKISDRRLGLLLSPLRSEKTCIIVDACFSGGFADKTIFDFPTLFLLRSNIPRSGRVVLSGSSKFRLGYASTTLGPLFTLIWFEGLSTGVADGFKPGFRNTGRPTNLKLFKDGKTSVEEAFYYARYKLKTEESLEEYSEMQPQINDQYPHNGIIRSIKEMYLGE